MARILTGADRLVAEKFQRLVGQRVGLVCNHTAVESRSLTHLADLMAAAPGVELSALFGPEHGVRGEAQDMIGVEAGLDPRTGVPVHSLYGHTAESLAPTKDMLAGLDVLVFDVQDVGTRYYTFAATMALCLKATAAAGIRLLVLDRPNPLGGTELEGGLVQPGFESFVGLYPVPVRHGLTVGELARWLQAEQGYGGELEVLSMEGWRRDMTFEDTGLDWILPSPNMPTPDTAWVYPGMCLVEATELSEGRGTTRPFELAGAPYIDPYRLAAHLEAARSRLGLGEVVFRPHVFRPTFHKHAGEACAGVFLHVRDRGGFRPYRTGLAFLEAVHALWPEAFAWREKPYEFVEDVPAVDLLTGSARVREALAAGADLRDVLAAEAEERAPFGDARRPVLLYP